MDFLRYLESIRTSFGENLFYYLTYGGEEIMLLAIVCILFWCVNKKTAYRIVFAYMPAILVINTLKISLKIERPWVRDPSFTAVEKAKASATGYSFPSGHTQCAVSLWGTLGLKTKKMLPKILFFALIPLVMLSRMYLGVHTPADVLASFAVSAVIAVVVNLVIDRLELTRKRRFIIMSFLTGLGILYVIYTFILLNTGRLTYADASDGCKGAAAGIAFAIGWYVESVHVRFDTRCKYIRQQILKAVIGIGGTLAIRSGIKALFEANIFIDMIRYFLMMSWAMMVMPIIIKHFFEVRENGPADVKAEGND